MFMYPFNVFLVKNDFESESESAYLLSQYKFTRKYVLRCTAENRINNRLLF